MQLASQDERDLPPFSGINITFTQNLLVGKSILYLAIFWQANLIGLAKAQTIIRADSTVRYNYFDGDSVASIKSIFTYDEKGRVNEETVQNWLSALMQWGNQSRTSYSYNQDRLDTIVIWSLKTSEWIPTNRSIIVYDAQEESTEIINQSWDTTYGSWLNLLQTFQGSLERGDTYLTKSLWDTTANHWRIIDSTISIISSSGFVITDTSYTLSPPNNSPVYALVTKYNYDSIGNVISRLRFSYFSDSLEFRPLSRDTFVYDFNRFSIQTQFDAWNPETQSWSPSFRIEQIPNQDGLLSESLILSVDFMTGQLSPTSRMVYAYTDGVDRSASADSLIHTIRNYSYMGSDEILNSISYYYYPRDPTTETEDLSNENSLMIYPNPAREHVILSGDLNSIDSYQWVTIDGRMLSKGKVSSPLIEVPRVNSASKIFTLILFDNQVRPLKVAKITIVDD